MFVVNRFVIAKVDCTYISESWRIPVQSRCWLALGYTNEDISVEACLLVSLAASLPDTSSLPTEMFLSSIALKAKLRFSLSGKIMGRRGVRNFKKDASAEALSKRE